MRSKDAITEREPLKPVASVRHSLLFFAIVAGVTALGFAAQHRETAGGGLTDAHAHVIPLYVSAAALDWLLLFFVWRGLRRRGTTLAELAGGRWTKARDVFRDLGLATAFWGLVLTVEWAIGHLPFADQAKSLDLLLPRTPLEVATWLFTCVTAGFCEELVFRGYLQRQLQAWSGNLAAAVLGQGLLFGLMHAYQGSAEALRIAVIGVLYGALAAGCRTLRVGMVAHAWQDLWAGWLGVVLLR